MAVVHRVRGVARTLAGLERRGCALARRRGRRFLLGRGRQARHGAEVVMMVRSILAAAFGVALASSAYAQGQAQQVTQAEIEAAVDRIGIPEGVDRQCVIDRAVQAAPNVSVGMLGMNGLTAANRQRANELGRQIRAGAAVQEGLRACTPEGSQTSAQETTVPDAKP